MTSPLDPATEDAYRASRGAVSAWSGHIEDVLARHGLREADAEIVGGHNPTYPTFIVGEVVVKFFGFVPTWRTTHAAERAAMTLLLQDPLIRAPRLLATGDLRDDACAPWPYLVISRVPGRSIQDARLTEAQRMTLAVELGEQLRRIHTLPPSEAMRAIGWKPVELTTALARSSLPPHLIEQAEDYITAMPKAAPCFLHGDLAGQHVFVERRTLRGFIDWGDAVVADPHLEWIQLYRDTFDCDATLFDACLAAYGCARDETFAHRTLGHALLRQALGLAQHLGMDVFEPIAAKHDLTQIPTLEVLATRLFEPERSAGS